MKNFAVAVCTTLAAVALSVALAIYLFWPRPHLEVKVCETKQSPDGRWSAVVQIEIYETAWAINDVVYAVRLKAPDQKDHLGDLVMTVPVSYPDPEPSVSWISGKLVVTLAGPERWQHLARSVDGVYIDVRPK